MEKTVKSLWEHALALISTQVARAKSYNPFKYSTINIILCECFTENNSLRAARGLSKIENIPYVSEDEDVIDYETEIFLNVLPYGIAAHLARDDDRTLFNDLYGLYERNKQSCKTAELVQVDDVY